MSEQRPPAPRIIKVVGEEEPVRLVCQHCQRDNTSRAFVLVDGITKGPVLIDEHPVFVAPARCPGCGDYMLKVTRGKPIYGVGGGG